MEYQDIKAKGRKHHNNQFRYGNKAKSTSKSYDSQKANIERGNNSQSATHIKRYENNSEEILPVENYVDNSRNFSLLSNTPISRGGHFQFKSDKDLRDAFDYESFKANKMFSLDLNILESSLSTVLFYERCGLDKDYLTDEQLDELQKCSHDNKIQYERLLKQNLILKDSLCQHNDFAESMNKLDLFPKLDSGRSNTVSDTNSSSKEFNLFEEDATLVTRKINNLHMEDDKNKEKDDLEEWLDELLND